MKYLFCSLLIALSCALQAQNLKSLLWEVKSPGNKISYIFGTYHLVGAGYLDEHPIVAQAYHESDMVVVETLIDSSRLPQVALMSMMPQNSLRQLLDTVEYQLLKEEFKRVTGVDIEALDRVKPIALASMYSMALSEKNTPEDLRYSGKPIDIHFATEATKQDKELRALETMLEQAELLFSSSSLEKQAEMLMELVRESNESSRFSRSILEAYEDEDLAKLWEISEQIGDAYGSMNVLLDDRNYRWMDSLVPWFNQGRVFVAVGALHLPGESGLLQLLRNKGYKLRPL